MVSSPNEAVLPVGSTLPLLSDLGCWNMTVNAGTSLVEYNNLVDVIHGVNQAYPYGQSYFPLGPYEKLAFGTASVQQGFFTVTSPVVVTISAAVTCVATDQFCYDRIVVSSAGCAFCLCLALTWSF